MNRRLLPLFLAAFTITGCVTPTPPVLTALDTQQGVILSRDEYKKHDEHRAPTISCYRGLEADPYRPACELELVKNKADKGTVVYYLRVRYYNHTWAFFDSAYDISGKRLKFHSLDQNVSGGGNVREEFALIFTPAELKKAQKTGMDISVRGQRKMQIIVPAFYIEGFLAATAK